MPLWIATLCDRFTEFWLSATPSTYWTTILFVSGLGWALGRDRN